MSSNTKSIIPTPIIAIGNPSSVTIDAAGERCIFFGRVTGNNWTSGTKSIRRVEYVISARTAGTGTTFRVYLADPDLVNGPPVRDDGVVDQFWETTDLSGLSVQINDPSSGYNITGDLSADRVVNIGDYICVVFDYSVFGSGTSLGIKTAASNIPATPGNIPSVTSYLSSVYASLNTGIPSIGFVFSDGSRGWIDGSVGVFLGINSTAFNTGSTGTTAIDAGDERGAEWFPDKNWKLDSYSLGCRVDTASGSVELVTYSGSTPIHTSVIDTNNVPLSTTSPIRVTYSSPVDIKSGSMYRFTLKPSSSVSGRMYAYDFANTEDIKWLMSNGETVQWTTATDGVFNSPTSASFRVPSIALFGREYTNEEYLSGSYVISGSVTSGGSPVSGATVRIVRQSDNRTISTSSAADGTYRFNVDTGSVYHVMAEYQLSGTLYNALSNWNISPV